MPTTKIFNGTEWIDLQGPEGPTVVSTDAGQVAKLGTDGKILVAQADLDSRYVNITGDTMTGSLIVRRDGVTGASAVEIQNYSDTANTVLNLRKTKGTFAAQTPLAAGDYVGRVNFSTIDTAAVIRISNLNCQVVGAPTATGIETNFSFAVCKTDGNQVAPLVINKDGIVVYGGSNGSGGVQSTYVNAAVMQVSQAAYINGPQFHAPTYGFGALMTPKSPAATSGLAGYNTQLTDAAPSVNAVCYFATHGGYGTSFNAGFQCSSNLAAGTNNYAFYSSWDAQNYFKGFTGIGWSTPTYQLEVGGTTMLRGTLDVTGNITSSGTAHNFAANSITRSAVAGISEPELDARYVTVAGDTMTGPLIIQPAVGPAVPDGSLIVVGNNTNANVSVQRHADTGNGGVFSLARSRGTYEAKTDVQVNDQIGTIAWRGYVGTSYRTGGYIRSTVASASQAGDTALRSLIEIGAATGTANNTTVFITGGNVGIQWSTPTYRLEVNGNTMLRGTCDITGNITSSGTAHNFAAASITRSAVAGISEPELDARYVNLTGDTMTGQLIVKMPTTPAAPDGSIQVIAEAANRANITVEGNTDVPTNSPTLWLKRSRGTTAAPTVVQAGDSLGGIGWRSLRADGTYFNSAYIITYCSTTPAIGETSINSIMNFSVGSGAVSPIPMTITAAGVGCGWTTPTNALEVGGTTKLRSTLDVTGNITSTGTAHNFAANSILSTAIKDLPIKTLVLTQAAYTALATKDPATLYLISG